MYGDYLIIPSLVSVAEQNRLAKFVGSNELPYRLYASYQHHFDEPDPRFVDPIQLSHHLYHDGEGTSPHFERFVPLIMELKNFFGNFTLYRVKVNCGLVQPGDEKYTPQTPHVDLQMEDGSAVEHWVCLYYIDHSDAPTYFFDKDLNIVKTIYPEKGKAILFDGSTLHAASNPALEPFRFILNIDLKPEIIPERTLNIFDQDSL